MGEFYVIDLRDGRCGAIARVHTHTRMVIVEVGPDLIDYEIGENDLTEISRMTLGPEDLVRRLIEGRDAGD